jgi:uncharacterized DUF497 family protein
MECKLSRTDNGTIIKAAGRSGNTTAKKAMRFHDEFEWDSKKATQNRRDHQITFDFAAEVLADDEGDVYLVEEHDDDHSEREERYTTIGSHPRNRRIVLRITWTERRSGERRITRIISARRASRNERKQYDQQISGRIGSQAPGEGHSQGL